MLRCDRRQFLSAAAWGAAAAPLAAKRLHAAQAGGKLPVAAIVTEYRDNSHADVIVGKILEGFEQDGGPGPGLELVSLYTDQVPSGDLSRGLAQKHGFRIAPSIAEALTLGGETIAVAGVLSIGEHGDYPYTPDTNQHMYPRKRFFDEIAAVFRKYEQSVPLFNDKHLAYRYRDAKAMYDAARELKVPFLAGSSLPVAWRYPPLALPIGCEMEEAVAVGYGGLESYGFHALETLQCMVERRQGGESGVAAIQAVQGDAIWQAEKEGRWSRELLTAALATMPDTPTDNLEERLNDGAALYLIEYRDGLKATVAMANGVARHFGFAAKLQEGPQPAATWFKLQDEKPFGHFGHLVKAIEHTVRTGEPAYPVERTLLTTGVLDRVMHSLADEGKRFATPELDVRYEAVDWPFANEV